MTLLVAHELGVALACTFGLLAVLMGGVLPAALWLAVVVPATAAVMRLAGRSLPAWVGTVISALGLLAGAATIAERGLDRVVVGGGIALMGTLVGRLLSRAPLTNHRSKTTAAGAQQASAHTGAALSHDMQALLVSLLLMFAGSVLHMQVTYGLVFVFYAIAVTWALVTRQLIAGAVVQGEDGQGAASASLLSRRDVATWRFFAATGGLAVAILMVTSLVFLLFPRVGLGRLGMFLGGGNRLPKEVSLSGRPRAIMGDDDVIARVRGVPYLVFSRGLYLKAQIYDHLRTDGFTQSPALSSMPRSELTVVPAIAPVRYQVYLQPVTDDRLLSLGPVWEARVLAGGSGNPSLRVRILGVGPGDELMPTNPITGPLRYAITGGIAQPGSVAPGLTHRSMRAHVEAHFLRLPEELDPRVRALARRWTQGASDHEAKAESLRGFLLNNFSYTLSQPNAARGHPLTSFLFEDRRGHCEYFATAFAVLLRAAGVPSRVVGGYQGGSWDESGKIVVFTGKNAHAWVEWYDAERGWRVDDATPAVSSPPQRLRGLQALLERMRRTWDDHIVDYGIQEQLGLLKAMAEAVRSRDGRDGTVGGQRRELLRWGLLIVVVGAAVWLASHLWRRSHRRRRSASEHPVGKALEQALERLQGGPVAGTQTLREVVRQTAPQRGEPGLRDGIEAAPPDVLWNALRMYEAERFGSSVPHRDRRAVIEALARVSGVGQRHK